MKSRQRKAFTLLELIVVVVILGVLAVIAVPTYRAVFQKTTESVAITAGTTIARSANAIAAFGSGSTTPAELFEANAEYAAENIDVTEGVRSLYVRTERVGEVGEACVFLDDGSGTAGVAGNAVVVAVTAGSPLECDNIV